MGILRQESEKLISWFPAIRNCKWLLPLVSRMFYMRNFTSCMGLQAETHILNKAGYAALCNYYTNTMQKIKRKEAGRVPDLKMSMSFSRRSPGAV